MDASMEGSTQESERVRAMGDKRQRPDQPADASGASRRDEHEWILRVMVELALLAGRAIGRMPRR